MKLFDKLCQPAKFYFILSMISYILIILQNIGNTQRFYLGNYSCTHSNPALVLITQGIYIILWTWILNIICKVNPGISWVIVLFPFILSFILLGLLLFQGIREDFANGAMSQFTP